MRVDARRRLASAPSTRACNSRRVRSSSMPGSAGVSVATTVPAATVSPSRSVMRDSCPVSGAETT